MLDVVRRVGCIPCFARFDQTLLVPPDWSPLGTFNADRCDVAPDSDGSGWRVTTAERKPSEPLLIADLVHRAPELLRVLALPAGHGAASD